MNPESAQKILAWVAFCASCFVGSLVAEKIWPGFLD